VIEQVRVTVDCVDQSNQQQALLANAAEAAESMRLQVQQLITAVSAFRLSVETPGGAAIRTADVPSASRIAHTRVLAARGE
jgi:hypothetical protein